MSISRTQKLIKIKKVGSSALSGKMLLVWIIENDKILYYAYSRLGLN